MKNDMKEILLEILKMVNERKHGGPILDTEIAEMEIIHNIADRLLSELHNPQEVKKGLVNMFLLGQVFGDHTKQER